MTQALPKLVTFEEFVDCLPENSGVRYELHNGEIIQMAEYQIIKFRDNDRIVSQAFPDLNLTANQIFQAGLV